MADGMKTIMFFREGAFYLTEYPIGYSNWAAEATRNPGTIRIEDTSGKVLWHVDNGKHEAAMEADVQKDEDGLTRLILEIAPSATVDRGDAS